MVHALTDAVPSDQNRVLHRLLEDRKRLSLFPKITKKFVYTSSTEIVPKKIVPLATGPNNMTKKRLMPKIIPQYKKEQVTPVYKTPSTRRPVMKMKKFTLLPYPIQPQSSEVTHRPFPNRYDTFESNDEEYGEEGVLMENNSEGEEKFIEEIVNDTESIEYDDDETGNPLNNFKRGEKNNDTISNLFRDNITVNYNPKTHNQTSKNDNNGNNLNTSKQSEKEETLKDPEGTENSNEEEDNFNEREDTNPDNNSDEVFDINMLDVIEYTTEDTFTNDKKSELTTKIRLSGKDILANRFEQNQSSFATIDPYLHGTVNKGTADLNIDVPVTKPMEKISHDFLELYDVVTPDPIMDRINARFKRNKR